MTTTQHTPGPWQDNDAGLIYGQVSGDEDEAPFVCDVCSSPLAYTEQEKANARLIAAAPDLLSAAELVIERWTRGDLAGAVRMLDAAVGAAKGGSI